MDAVDDPELLIPNREVEDLFARRKHNQRGEAIFAWIGTMSVCEYDTVRAPEAFSRAAEVQTASRGQRVAQSLSSYSSSGEVSPHRAGSAIENRREAQTW